MLCDKRVWALSHADTLEISCHSSTKVLLPALKSLLIPRVLLPALKSLDTLLEYCCQLWNSWKAKDIQAIAAIQLKFTYKSTALELLGKTALLGTTGKDSLQRRRERYRIIYIWMIIQHMVPNIDGTIGHTIKTRKHTRHGTQCVIQYPTNRNPANPFKKMQ